MITPHQEWHWGEGNKYALEAMKALLYLNGGAAIALLTFIGNRSPAPANKAAMAEAVGNSLLCFSIGTVTSVLVLVFAYITQLHYGNEHPLAPRSHHLTYVMTLLTVIAFIAGIYFARTAVIASL